MCIERENRGTNRAISAAAAAVAAATASCEGGRKTPQQMDIGYGFLEGEEREERWRRPVGGHEREALPTFFLSFSVYSRICGRGGGEKREKLPRKKERKIEEVHFPSLLLFFASSNYPHFWSTIPGGSIISLWRRRHSTCQVQKRLLLFPPHPIVHFSLSAVEHEDKRRQFSPLPSPLQSTMVRLICVSFPLRLRFSSRKMPLSVSPRSRRVIA